MEEARARVRLEGDDYRTAMLVRQHAFFADEPPDKGGADTAPTPTELMTAALGACTAITLRMYAKRKGWTLGKIQVEVGYDVEADVRAMELRITCSAPLTDEQRARLLQIAHACPVHKALAKPVEVKAEIAATELASRE